jgi:Tol biopolymer transport system component
VIAFVRHAPERDVLIHDIDAGETTPIAANANIVETAPVWTPDGVQLVFLMSMEIFRLSLDENFPVQITVTPFISEFNQQVAPTGDVVAFVTAEFGLMAQRVNVIGLDGSGSTELAFGVFGRDISWFPEGDRFTVSTSDRDLYIVPIDDSEPTLIETGGTVEQAVVSPDGTRIAFASNRDGTRRIYTCAPDGSDVVVWTAGAADSYPTWSPSGMSLAFVRGPGGARVLMLVGPNDVETVLDASGDVSGPLSWSPDGAFVTYTSEIAIGRRVFMARADGIATSVVRLTDDEDPNIAEADPQWRP